MKGIFAYREDSILNNPIVRFANYILLLLCALVPAISIEYEADIRLALLLPVIALPLAGVITHIAIKNTKFYSSAEEQRKRMVFSFTYLIVSYILVLLLAYHIAIGIVILPGRGWWLFIIPAFIVILNIFNIPSLHFWLFEKEITIKQGYVPTKSLREKRDL